jgi:hypothetical protein
MRFSTTSVLALAAGASASAVIPRSPYGQWEVQVTVSEDRSTYVTAFFTSDSYPEGLRNACVENPYADPPLPKRCDHAATTFDYDGESKFKSQNAERTGTNAKKCACSHEHYAVRSEARPPDFVRLGILAHCSSW